MNAAWPEDALLPQIGHLTVAQLRQRAACDREDAKRLDARRHPCAIRMLLTDAERCDALADSRMVAQQSPLDGLARMGAGVEAELLARAFKGCLALSSRKRGRADRSFR